MRQRTHPIRILCTALLLGSVLTVPTGCLLLLGGAVAAGTITYVKGELKTLEEASLDRTWDASLSAVQALDFRVVEKQKDGLNGTLVSNTADGTKVQIELEKRSKSSTEINIRVGIFGDRDKSTLILSTIRERL